MLRRRVALLRLAMVVGGCLLLCLTLGKAQATTGVDQELSFEGKIVTAAGINIADATYNMEFKIYTAATACNATTGSGCTLGWTEDWLVSASQGVTTSSGTFEVNLDSVAANNFSGINFNSYPLYLSIQVGSTTSCAPAGNFTTNCGGDTEMKPYIPLTAAPYALDANQVGGLTAAQLVQLTPGSAQTGNINVSSTVAYGAGTASGNSLVCQNSSGQLASCTSAVVSGNAFVQNGNDFGGNAVLGTTGAGETLSLETANTSRATLDASGNLNFLQASAIDINSATTGSQLTVQGGDATSGTNVGGNLLLQGGAGASTGASGSVVVQSDTNNSVTAFQVQNANSVPIFNVDTTTLNLLTNPGFEVNASGWSGSGTGASCAQNTATKNRIYFGLGSLECTLATSGTTTATVNSFTQTLASGVAYTISFYAMSDAAVTLGSTVTFTGGGVTCTLNSTAVTSSGFQRYWCTTPTTSGVTTSISFTTATNSTNLYVDSAQLVVGSTLTPYQIGAIQLRGVIDNPATFQSLSNSTDAFKIQNNASVNTFSIDTLNNVVNIGNGKSGDTTGIELVVDNKTNSGDPTCTSGAIYYNSSSGNNEFRACRGGTWFNLIAGVDVQIFSATGTWTAPAGISTVMVIACGGGGSGGGGQTRALLAAGGGGSGGAGGARIEEILTAADAGSSQTVTVGAQTTGGAVASPGNNGNTSSFGTLLSAFGGGGGAAGATATTSGGSGGGVGATGTVGAGATHPGADTNVAANSGIGYSGGYGQVGTAGGFAEYGGGGGGGGSTAAGLGGGSSDFGGAGGGSGGSTTTSNVNNAGGAGGEQALYVVAGGGGVAGGTAGGGAGNAGAVGSSVRCGGGGSGGGGFGTALGFGGVGGAGGAPGGGGGGGGVGTSTDTGGVGGVGAAGRVWVFSW